MLLSEKFVRRQLEILKPLITGASLQAVRLGQNAMGALTAKRLRRKVTVEINELDGFRAAWITPENQRPNQIILYLHGGGYVAGGIDYAKGFGSVLAAKTGISVFCPAYRLAPENPFPAALDDAMTAYRYLLKKGYRNSQILLCGESAGGGLVFSLCLQCKATGTPLPCGIVAISPWTDLTLSGKSYEKNRERDPSMTIERLKYYVSCYTDDITSPFVSPLFGDLTGFPPSLIFAGGDEIMLDDSVAMNQKLIDAGNQSELVISPGMWHAYILYGLRERKADAEKITYFIDKVLNAKSSLRWMKLDNAAKIYPAAKRRKWSNVFRLSATLTENVDPVVLQTVLDNVVRRFPSISARIRRGMFWYYIEELPKAPKIQMETSHPLAHMPFTAIRKCALRVLYYENRIAIEVFHALTDGNGAMVFLKTLVSEYIEEKRKTTIPHCNGVLDCEEEPRDEELEDSFLVHSGDVKQSRRDVSAYRLRGTREPDRYVNIITGILDVNEALAMAKSYKVSLTVFLAAVMVQSIMEIQEDEVHDMKRRKPVKVLIPVDLRRIYGSESLRNFVLFVTPGVNPKLGTFTLEEIMKAIHHQMGVELTAIRPLRESLRKKFFV